MLEVAVKRRDPVTSSELIYSMKLSALILPLLLMRSYVKCKLSYIDLPSSITTCRQIHSLKDRLSAIRS
jgi:hypothetical protein